MIRLAQSSPSRRDLKIITDGEDAAASPVEDKTGGSDKKTAVHLCQEEDVIDTHSDVMILEHWDDPDIRQRVCSTCGYRGKWTSEMIRHKRVHTNERPFRCKICSRTSKWRADLIRHLNRMHGIRVLSRNTRTSAQSVDDGREPPTLTPNVNPNKVPAEDANQPTDNGQERPKPMIRLRIRMNGSGDSGAPSVRIVNAKAVSQAPEEAVEPQASSTPPPPARPPCTTASVGTTQAPPPSSRVTSPVPVESKLKTVLQKYAIITASSHGNYKWLRCRLCPYATWDAQTFRVHTQKHENKKPYQCSTCGYRSNWSSDVHKHIRFKRASHYMATVIKLTDTMEDSPIRLEESDSSGTGTEEATVPPPNVVVKGDAVQPLKRELQEDGESRWPEPASTEEVDAPMDTSNAANVKHQYCVALDLKDVCDVMSDFMAIINAAGEGQLNGAGGGGKDVEDFSVHELRALSNSNGQFLVHLNGVQPTSQRPRASAPLAFVPKKKCAVACPGPSPVKPTAVAAATFEHRAEIRKVEVVVNGDRRKMWQCRYCSHVSKRRANVRMHEKKHFKVKRRKSAVQQVHDEAMAQAQVNQRSSSVL